jgi:hypothetical protein
MSVTNYIQGLLTKIAKFVPQRSDSDFTCADCERSNRCALPPSKSCIFRAEQIAGGDWKVRSRPKIVIGW